MFLQCNIQATLPNSHVHTLPVLMPLAYDFLQIYWNPIQQLLFLVHFVAFPGKRNRLKSFLQTTGSLIGHERHYFGYLVHGTKSKLKNYSIRFREVFSCKEDIIKIKPTEYVVFILINSIKVVPPRFQTFISFYKFNKMSSC